MSFVLEFTTYKNFMDESINNKITQFNINTKILEMKLIFMQ
jgi:hypothetical protein